MDFDTWHYNSLNGDRDNCPHEKWERAAWVAALTACAELLESESHKLAGTANDCCDIGTRLRIKTEEEIMLRAALMVRSNA